MKKLLILLPTFLLTSALALPGHVPAATKLYAKADLKSAVLATLPAKAPLDVKSCTGGPQGWCSVSAAGKTGFIPRAQVYGKGNCAALRAVGLGDLVRGEASYNGTRDRDGDGRGCDQAQ